MGTPRVWLGVAAGAVVAAAGAVLALAASSPIPVGTGVAGGGWLALAISWPHTRARVPVVTAVSAATSIGVTATVLVTGSSTANTETSLGLLMLVETGALLALLAWCVRSATIPVAIAAGGATAVAQATILLRAVLPVSPLELVGIVGFWGLGSVGAAGIGLYVRWLDEKRVRAVDSARRTQRLDLARDLHDFVAHDVSGIVVQAQAAQVILAQNPDEALAALKRIEDAGLQALESMDRTVHMLHEVSQTPSRSPLQGLADLTEVAERFAAGGDVSVEVSVEPGLASSVPREANTTAYRVVVEALTNIRRHAPSAARVDISARRTSHSGKPALTVTITNDSSGHASSAIGGDSRRQGGLGLLGLTERVEAIGGTLTAGPHAPNGWRTEAVLPLPGGDP